MAYKRKRSYRKKPFVRRQRRRRGPRRGQRSKMRLMKCPTSFPSSMRVKLSFCMVSSAPIAIPPPGAGNPVVWRIIGGHRPFEVPLNSLSNMQPQGWDQWANAYNSYRVMGMKVRLEIKNTAPATAQALSVACYWSSDGSVIGSAAGILANRFTHSRVLGFDDNFVYTTFCRPWTVLDIPKREYMSDVTFTTGTGINPISPASLWVELRNTHPVSNANLIYKISGNLYVEFRYLKTLIDS